MLLVVVAAAEGTPGTKVDPHGSGVQAERGGSARGGGGGSPEDAREKRLVRPRGEEGDFVHKG